MREGLTLKALIFKGQVEVPNFGTPNPHRCTPSINLDEHDVRLVVEEPELTAEQVCG